MRLSTQTHNAVKVLVHCTRAGGKTVTVPEIAAACDITEFNVFKLLPLLVKGELLETIRGRSGGVCLKKPADEISIGAVVRATEAVFRNPAKVPASGTANEPNDYSDMVNGAFLAFVEFLDQKTIADLAEVDGASLPDAGMADESTRSDGAGSSKSASRN